MHQSIIAKSHMYVCMVCIKALKTNLKRNRTSKPLHIRFSRFNNGSDNQRIQRILEFWSLSVALLGSSKSSRVWVEARRTSALRELVGGG